MSQNVDFAMCRAGKEHKQTTELYVILFLFPHIAVIACKLHYNDRDEISLLFHGAKNIAMACRDHLMFYIVLGKSKPFFFPIITSRSNGWQFLQPL